MKCRLLSTEAELIAREFAEVFRFRFCFFEKIIKHFRVKWGRTKK